MLNVGVPRHIAEMNVQAFALLARGDADWISNDLHTIIGRPQRSFEQFVKDNAISFA